MMRRSLMVAAGLAAMALILSGLIVDRSLSRTVADPPTPPASAIVAPTEAPPVFVGSRRVAANSAAANTVALTFDDGPDPVWTPKILDVLDRHGVTATFFILGERALEERNLVREIVRRGHEIGNHTFSHPAMGRLPAWERRLQISLAQNAILSASGTRPTTYRPPYSSRPEWTPSEEVAALDAAADAGLVTVLTDAPTQDWNPRRTVAEIVASATTGVRPGWTITMHDGGGADRARTVRATELIIRRLRAQGHRFVPVSQLSAVNYSRRGVTARERLASNAVVMYVGAIRGFGGAATWVSHFLVGLMLLFVLRNVAALIFCLVYVRRSRRYDPDDAPHAASVIVPAFNEAAGIADSVRSLVRTTLPEVEVIVVDDGSTDGTMEIVEGLALPNVRVIRQRNAGKAAALRRGVAAARHEAIVMVDADSMFEPETLPELVTPFADARIGAVAGNVRVANRGSLLGKFQHVEYTLGSSVDRRAMDVLGFVLIIPGAVGAFRRAALDEIGGVPVDTMCEDYDLTTGLQRAGWRVAFASRAYAVTEVPADSRSLFRQRYRWMFGTLQVLWKHRGTLLFRDRSRWWGPAAVAYGFLLGPIGLSMLPFIAAFLIYGLAIGDVSNLVIGLLLAGLVVLLVAAGLVAERDRLRDLPLVLIQLPYTSTLTFLVLIAAVGNALKGLRPRWRTNRRTGIGSFAAGGRTEA